MKHLLPIVQLFLLVVFFLSIPKTSRSTPQSTEAVPADTITYQGVHPDTLPPMELDDPLPLDPHVRVDTLENGFVYYIRENTEPANRAQLRLGINAGSILEEDDQRGLAHFLEHMLFNGTKRFEKQEIVNFMERIGMEFGPDVNASTGYDETIYQLQIPTDSAEIVERSFDILEDWAAHATLEADAIDDERGIIIEEWRQRLETASGRMMQETMPVYVGGSRYIDRTPIGDTTTIKNVSPERIRAFYEDWYRPDLMTVVAVGDFDADHIEELIRDRFSHLTMPENPPARVTYDVPLHDSTIYKVVTDPEYPSTSVEVSFKQPGTTTRTVRDRRLGMIRSMFRGMLNERFDEIEREPTSPFVHAYNFRGSLTRTSDYLGLRATVSEDSIYAGLEALMREVMRVHRHGFTTSELEREKQDRLRASRSAFEERETWRSSSHARGYLNHYMEQLPQAGIAYSYALDQRYLPGITVEEVNRVAEDFLAQENRAVLVRMPENDSLEVPARQQLASVFERVQEEVIEPYVDDVQDEPLLSEVPMPVSVTARNRIDTLDVTEITLENGVRVVMKPTDFQEDEVQMTAFSPGGTSLVSDADYFEAAHAATIVSRSGVGSVTRTQLNKKLSGLQVTVGPYISEVEEGFSGSASPEDLETMFKLIHLYATQPRADSSALEAFKNQMRTSLERRSVAPQAAFQDTLVAALFGRDLRRMTPTIGMVDSLDLQDAIRIYRDRFADLSDFTFVFVGNFALEDVEMLSRQYLGTLPAMNRKETWRDVAPDPRPGIVTKEVRKGQGNRSQTVLAFHDSLEYSRVTSHRLRSMAEVLNIKLREDLREKRSAVYSVQAQGNTSRRPDQLYRVIVVYGSSPDSAEVLADAIFEHVDSMKSHLVDQDYIDRVKEQQRRERETAMENNGFWIGILSYYYSQKDEDLLDIVGYDELIDSLTREEIREAAREYLDTSHYVKVVLYPEPSFGPRRQPSGFGR